MVNIIPNFLVLHFGEKIAKFQIHENWHKMRMKACFHSHFFAIYREFYEGQIKATNTLQLSTANYNLFKMEVQYEFFPILMVQMLFPQNQQVPGHNFSTEGKSLCSRLHFQLLMLRY